MRGLGAVKTAPPCFIPNDVHNENVKIGSVLSQEFDHGFTMTTWDL
jgi:hypothetical protein